MILAGGVFLEPVMRMTGAVPRIVTLAPEGAELKAGDMLAEVEGKLAGLLTGERTALNFIQLLVGYRDNDALRRPMLSRATHAKKYRQRARLIGSADRREVRSSRWRRA